MKLLIVDTLAEPGHKNFDSFYLRLLSGDHDVTFLSKENYVKVDSVTIKKLSVNLLEESIGQLSYRLQQLVYLKYVNKVIKTEKFDCVIFLSYETITFSIFSHLCRHKKIFLINHNNIDQVLQSQVKKFFFSTINKSINHVFFESYISKFIENRFGFSSITIPHPIYRFLDYSPNTSKTIFSPSNTKNIDIINGLVDFSIKHNYNLILKSNISYHDKKNILSRPFFSDFDDKMLQASFIFIPTLFSYRVSGVLHEALSCNRPVIGFTSTMLIEMKKKYPSIVFCIDSFSDINNIMLEPKAMLHEFSLFRKDHSNKLILNKFLKQFEGG